MLNTKQILNTCNSWELRIGFHSIYVNRKGNKFRVYNVGYNLDNDCYEVGYHCIYSFTFYHMEVIKFLEKHTRIENEETSEIKERIKRKITLPKY